MESVTSRSDGRLETGSTPTGVPSSTAACVILFGSVTVTTIAMILKWGDVDEIVSAIIVDIKNKGAGNSNSNSNWDDSRSLGSLGSRSASGSRWTRGSFRSVHSTKLEPWEPTFVSTFTLLFQITMFGMVLSVVYFIDTYPPFGAARAEINGSSYYYENETCRFEVDQFAFMLTALVFYMYSTSWRRNDGRSERFDKSISSSRSVKSEISAKSEADREKRTLPSFAQSSSRDRDNLEEKQLDDVFLDEGTSKNFHSILNTIEDEIAEIRDVTNASWLEKLLNLLGFDLDLQSEKKSDLREVWPGADLLNSFQTSEMKGFLSVALLIYRFSSLGPSNFDYHSDQSIDSEAKMYLAKVATTAFLFLTGYCHASYFYYSSSKKQEREEVPRLVGTVFRINFSAMFLSLVIGKAEYIAIPVLHTISIMVIWFWFTMHRSTNYVKYQFRRRLFGLGVLIFVFWDCELLSVFGFHSLRGSFPSIWECYYVSHMHHWAAFLGVIFAVNQKIASLQLRKLESMNPISSTLAKGTICFVFLSIMSGCTAEALKMPSLALTLSHRYFGIFPVLAYVYFRNVSKSLREHHIGALSWLGRYSLEVYLLQHHAFTDRGCINVIRGYPRCNFAFVAVLLVGTARALNHITTILRHMLLPMNDDEKCIKNAVRGVTGVAVLYAITSLLSGWLSFGSVLTISIISGIILYQSIVEATYADFMESREATKKQSSLEDVVTPEVSETRTRKFYPHLFFALATMVFLLSSLWGYSRLQTCQSTANDGYWVPIDPCLSDRQFNHENYIDPGDCAGVEHLQWAWPRARCNYHHHSPPEVQHELKGMRIVLIGDSSMRGIFHSLSRSLGDFDENGYEGSNSHTDKTVSYESTSLEFKWAPLSVDIVTKFKSLKASSKPMPDLIIAGGGVLDKLQLSITHEDARVEVTKMAEVLSNSNAMVCWFTPPTINTQALNSDDKRLHINEDAIEEMRKLYHELGVLASSSFILDGPSFTKDRVLEAYDGIQYPPPVYDAGVQILLNELSRLKRTSPGTVQESTLASVPLGNPYLGLGMLVVTLIGLFYFDAYFGLSYLAQLFVINGDKLSPGDLYKEAFKPVFKRLKMSPPEEERTDTGPHESSLELEGRNSSSLSRRR